MVTVNNDSSFDNRVFINCPFDSSYDGLFKACIYTVLFCGFYPVTALEYNDGYLRLEKILDQIKGCRLGIHDLSVVNLDSENNLPRFNMPFELGIHYGSIMYAGRSAKRKKFLIFESSKYTLAKYLSDLAGCDPVCHDGNPEKVISEVRKWLYDIVSEQDEYHRLPGEKKIQGTFTGFCNELPTLCKDTHTDLGTLTYKNLVHLMKGWIERIPT